MTEPARFINETLQYEGSPERGEDERRRLGSGLAHYGASVGAVRGVVRDAGRKFRGLGRDEVVALASELWGLPVFERRLAAIVLLQSRVKELDAHDLTRIEGFVREARIDELVDPLAVDVTGPLVARLDGRDRERAEGVLDRWAVDGPVWLARAALLASAVATGEDAVARRARLAASAHPPGELERATAAAGGVKRRSH
ncbi:DNA alkylation repair protein [Herbiconiux sp. SYSU D00978]|uniref:DNA alkylation repair protein n=1 Tax=Herbiconiux sp. SYSU D00978 TaxID=2812562 RepID=UPI001A9654D4|nr:DNA alkylation repair protein [Herbiconiux sp. SYSU D00978]